MFGKRSFMDRDVEAFHIQCWSWLLRHDQSGDFEQTPLVLPTAEFFPASETEGHERAAYILGHVLEHARMGNWPVELVPQQERAGRVGLLATVHNIGNPAGTFCNQGNTGRISYDPGLIDQPIPLIAVFAHELGHYLCSAFHEPPPGGWDLNEPATDVAACFLGFGIFGANASFEYSQFADHDIQGWQSRTLGYITEAEWVFNLAIFCALRDIDIEVTKSYLKPHLFSEARRASKYVLKQAIVSEIRANAAPVDGIEQTHQTS